MTATRLLIIRHGNTFGPEDAPRRVGVKTDIPLVESGIAQAQSIGHYLRDHDLIPDTVFASELQRAQQTAAIMMKTSGAPLPVHTDSNFNEIDHGPDENKTEDEILERLGQDALDDWNNFSVVPDGWNVDPRDIQQNWIKLGQDCQSVMEGKTTCIVSSGGIIRFAPILLPNGYLPDNQQPKVKTGSMSLLTYDHKNEIWVCDFWNKRPE